MSVGATRVPILIKQTNNMTTLLIIICCLVLIYEFNYRGGVILPPNNIFVLLPNGVKWIYFRKAVMFLLTYVSYFALIIMLILHEDLLLTRIGQILAGMTIAMGVFEKTFKKYPILSQIDRWVSVILVMGSMAYLIMNKHWL